jgi:MFS family permease
MDADAPSPAAGGGALAFVFLIVFLDVLGLTILNPVLAYIVRCYSHEALTVTLMTVTYATAQFLAAPLLGHLSDRCGRRPVLLLSILGSAVGYLLFGVGGGLWVLFAARLLDGFTAGNISTAMAYIADITPAHAGRSSPARARNFGGIGVAFGVGYVIGPALGGALSRLSLTAPAFAAGGLSLLSVLVGLFLLPESLPRHRRSTAPLRAVDVNPLALIGSMFRYPAVRMLLLAMSAFLLAFTGTNSIMPVFLIERFHAEPVRAAGLFLVAGATTALTYTMAGKLTARYGEQRLIQTGFVMQLVCALAYLATTALPWFGLLYGVSGLSGGSSALIYNGVGTLLMSEVSGQDQGKAAGVNAALQSLMTACGPLWAGAAYDHIGAAAPFWSGAVFLTFGLVLLQRERRSPWN